MARDKEFTAGKYRRKCLVLPAERINYLPDDNDHKNQLFPRRDNRRNNPINIKLLCQLLVSALQRNVS